MSEGYRQNLRLWKKSDFNKWLRIFPGAVFRKPEPMQNQCFTCRTICGCLPCEILNESLSFCYPQRCGERRKRHQTTIFFTKSAPLRNWYKYRLRCGCCIPSSECWLHRCMFRWVSAECLSIMYQILPGNHKRLNMIARTRYIMFNIFQMIQLLRLLYSADNCCLFFW